MRLYLIRHGETNSNKDFRFIGNTDDPLSEEGLVQAKETAASLIGVDIKAIYSSDLKRAMQTAEIIAKSHSLEVKAKNSLREIDFGDWELLTYDDIDVLYHDIFKRWLADPVNTQIPGGESWKQFRGRILFAVKEIVDQEKDGNVIVVLHGGPIKLLVSYLNGDDPMFFKSFWPAPGSVNIVEIPRLAADKL